MYAVVPGGSKEMREKVDGWDKAESKLETIIEFVQVVTDMRDTLCKPITLYVTTTKPYTFFLHLHSPTFTTTPHTIGIQK